MRAFVSMILLTVFVALGACQRTGDALSVEHLWAAASPNGATVAAGYFTINNTSDTGDQLLAAASPRAAHVQVHEMHMNGAIMEMRAVERLNIPAHGRVSLSPGGYHLMFSDITAPFKAGETAPVTLTFRHHAPITIALPVRSGADMVGDGM